MKNLIAALVITFFASVTTVSAQETKPQDKKECTSKDKKSCTKDKKTCSAEEKKSCDKTKKSCCAAKTKAKS